ncbi:hypothetical protein WJX75_005630 [Coccomyxa subellipsoidea]|uniref:Uncharacterized protein n=1 Tax=Coccomyxa subellipsoidea TaxID=248742 RepID=A0ABR2YDX9_9CHLO
MGVAASRAGGISHRCFPRTQKIRLEERLGRMPLLIKHRQRYARQPILTAGLPAATWLSEPAASTTSLMLLSAVLGFSIRALLQPVSLKEQSTPAPEELWSAAWSGFETPSALSTDSNRSGTQSLRDRLLGRGMSSTSSPTRRRQELKQTGNTQQTDASLQRPRLSLQGIAPAARLELLSCSLAALEKQIIALPDSVSRASELEWSAVMSALLESSSALAAQGWLGYAPQGLNRSSLPFTKGALRMEEFSAVEALSGGRQTEKSIRRVENDDSRSAAELQSDEKAAVHAAVVSYLRFPPQAASADVAHSSQERPFGNERELADSRRSNGSTSTSTASIGSRREQAMALLSGRGAQGSGDLASSPEVERGESTSQAVTPLLLRRGAAIIQDMAMIIAEAVAESYLADAGLVRGGEVGRAGLRVGSWPLHLHRRILSTRSLERFRNQVALQQWLDRNFTSVTAMYEDRHELWGFDHQGRLFRRMLPARRAQEVERLKGLRYAHSLALEAMDVAAPLFQRLLGRLGDAVSWLLVRLIGRSLGLIYRGVRESLVPRGRNPGGDKSPSPQLDGL